MYLQQANKGKNDWWRWVLTIVLVFFGYLIGQLPLFFLMNKVVMDANEGIPDFNAVEALTKSMDFTPYGTDPNFVLVMVLLMFVFGILALWLGIAKLHHRSFRSLITPMAKINWSKIFFSFGLWTLLSLILEGVSYFMNPENYVYNFNLATFVPLVIISFTLLPIQTSFEELFMRGYLMQGMSRWSVYR